MRRQRARLRKPARMDDSYISHTLQINSPHMKGVTSIRLIERKHADSEGGAPPDIHEAYAVRLDAADECGGCAPTGLGAQWAIDARPLCVLWTKRAGLAPHPCGRAANRSRLVARRGHGADPRDAPGCMLETSWRSVLRRSMKTTNAARARKKMRLRCLDTQPGFTSI